MKRNMLWTWREITKSKRYFAIILLLMLIETIVSLSAIAIQKWIVDDVFGSGLFERLPNYIALFAAAVVLDAAMFTLVKTTVIQYKGKLRYRFISGFMDNFYKNEKTAKLLQIVTKEIDAIANLLAGRIPEGIQLLAKTAILIVTVGMTSVNSLFVLFVLCPAYIALGNHFAGKMKRLSKEKQESRAELLAQMEEGISSTREIIAYDRQRWEAAAFTRLFDRYFNKVKEDGAVSDKQGVMEGLLKWAVNLSMLAFFGYEVMRQSMSVGTFLVVYQFSVQLLDSTSGSYNFIVGLSSAYGSVERYREATSFNLLLPGTIKLQHTVRNIRFENVHFQYKADGPFVLQGVSVDLPAGKKLAFVGTSGGGKSTIVQLLARFVEPSVGRITVNGLPLGPIRRQDWTDKVNVVFQEPYLFPDSIRNNITFGRSVTEEALVHACRMVHIYETVVSLPQGFDTVVGERGISLSGGQRQRIAIARALLADPEILILDEATSALDPETERIVQRNLDRTRQGRTTILIAHRLATVADADIIYVLEQGRIAEQGTYQELVQAGTVFNKLVQSQLHADRGA